MVCLYLLVTLSSVLPLPRLPLTGAEQLPLLLRKEYRRGKRVFLVLSFLEQLPLFVINLKTCHLYKLEELSVFIRQTFIDKWNFCKLYPTDCTDFIVSFATTGE